MITNENDVVKLPHHERLEVCTSRAKYRQGRKFTAVKVYTVNDESQHLIVTGIPALGIQDELRRLCSKYGEVKSLVFIPSYEEEEFREAYHIVYVKIQAARFAKHNLDDKSYFGSILHVCYAPEMESVAETRNKLIQRRKDIARRTRGGYPVAPKSKVTKQFQRQKKHPALPISVERLSTLEQGAECIWNGIPQDIDPRLQYSKQGKLETVYGPQKPDHKWVEAGIREQRIIPMKKTSSTQSQHSTVLQKPNDVKISKNFPPVSPQVLKFVPTQVKNARRIIFHKSIQKGQNINNDMESTNEKSANALNNLSIEETILSVRKKIKAVSVPSIQVVLEQK